MKKFFLILLSVLALGSCSSDVTFNNPGMQARKENITWRADNPSGKIVSGQLSITGYNGADIVTLSVKAPLSNVYKNNPVTYTFGTTDAAPTNTNFASYTTKLDGVELIYKTDKTVSNGQLVITSFDLVTRKLSGTFRFNATYSGTDSSIQSNINFQEGYLFDVLVY